MREYYLCGDISWLEMRNDWAGLKGIGMVKAKVTEGKSIGFSFNTGTPADSNDEKTIYIYKDMEKLELNARLTVDSGNVTVQVLDNSSDETVWNHSYNENTNFKIELTDLKADSEYLLKITTVQSKKVNLTITTEEKLVKDKDKPNKYN